MEPPHSPASPSSFVPSGRRPAARWPLDADWTYESDFATVTELHARRDHIVVEFEHRDLER